MLTSEFSLQKRQQSQDRTKKWLTVGFLGSALFHGFLAVFAPGWLPQVDPEETKKPIELVLIEPPKPQPVETKLVPELKPLPKPRQIETPPPQVKTPEPPPKPKVEPKPQPKVTPPPQVKAPEPPPKRILSKPQPSVVKSTPAPTTVNQEQPKVSVSQTIAPTEVPTAKVEKAEPKVAVNSAPPAPSKPTTDPTGISCVSNCQPEYPDALDGSEGSAGIKLTIDKGGNVTNAVLANGHKNPLINRLALLAARRMKFNSISNEAGALIAVKINFTVKGSKFDRTARARQEKLEAERKAKLERERQAAEAARQREIEQERKVELERQQQQSLSSESVPSESVSNKSSSEAESVAEDELLRKFRERIKSRQAK